MVLLSAGGGKCSVRVQVRIPAEHFVLLVKNVLAIGFSCTCTSRLVALITRIHEDLVLQVVGFCFSCVLVCVRWFHCQTRGHLLCKRSQSA